MRSIVQEFDKAKKNLFEYFDCEDEYYIKSITECNWRIVQDDGIIFLNYWNEGARATSAVVVKKDGQPLIFPTKDYTMVVAIDCIKIAFILNNSNQ